MAQGCEVKLTENTIGWRIRYARKQKKISQLCLAMRSDIRDQSSVSKIERGVYKPKPGTVRRIADALGVSADWIING